MAWSRGFEGDFTFEQRTLAHAVITTIQSANVHADQTLFNGI